MCSARRPAADWRLHSCGAVLHCAVQCRTVHCALQCRGALCSAVPCSTAHASPLPQLEADKLSSKVHYFSILHCSILLQCSAVFQYSAGHYGAVHCFSALQCTSVGSSLVQFVRVELGAEQCRHIRERVARESSTPQLCNPALHSS